VVLPGGKSQSLGHAARQAQAHYLGVVHWHYRTPVL
jgi:hypothetical protein